jgi:hypothetical protein
MDSVHFTQIASVSYIGSVLGGALRAKADAWINCRRLKWSVVSDALGTRHSRLNAVTSEFCAL